MQTIEWNTTFQEYQAGADLLDGVIRIRGTQYDWEPIEVFVYAGQNAEALIGVHPGFGSLIIKHFMARPHWVERVDAEHQQHLPAKLRTPKLIPAWAE